MSRSRIKIKTVKSSAINKDVASMFNGALGSSDDAGGLPIHITHPKYMNMKTHVERFLTLLDKFGESKIFELFPQELESLNKYSAQMKEQYDKTFNAPVLDQWLVASVDQVGAYANVPVDVVVGFNLVFVSMKKSDVVGALMLICKELIMHKASLNDFIGLNGKFITKSSSMTFSPVAGLDINFKQLYIDDRLTRTNREFILVILHKLYKISYDLYEALSSPDVDVNDFVSVIMSSISDVKKYIPGCDLAFQKIIESVEMLKGNFNNYYKDFAATGNPTIIMENFVLDVAKSTNASPVVTSQFKKIISHYRKLAAQQSQNPKMRSLFEQVDSKLSELEKLNKKADEAPTDGAAAQDDDDGDDEFEASDAE